MGVFHSFICKKGRFRIKMRLILLLILGVSLHLATVRASTTAAVTTDAGTTDAATNSATNANNGANNNNGAGAATRPDIAVQAEGDDDSTAQPASTTAGFSSKYNLPGFALTVLSAGVLALFL